MPEPNFMNIFEEVEGGAVGCCGGSVSGGAVKDYQLYGALALVIIFILYLGCKCGFELLEGYGNVNVYDRRTGGLAGARSERDDTGYSAPNFQKDAAAYTALVKANTVTPSVKVPAVTVGKSGVNLSASRAAQRERLAEFDAILDITDIKPGKQLGYVPETSDDELLKYL
jgi:hypothetical protein